MIEEVAAAAASSSERCKEDTTLLYVLVRRLMPRHVLQLTPSCRLVHDAKENDKAVIGHLRSGKQLVAEVRQW